MAVEAKIPQVQLTEMLKLSKGDRVKALVKSSLLGSVLVLAGFSSLLQVTEASNYLMTGHNPTVTQTLETFDYRGNVREERQFDLAMGLMFGATVATLYGGILDSKQKQLERDWLKEQNDLLAKQIENENVLKNLQTAQG
jgi:hypothetical protein